MLPHFSAQGKLQATSYMLPTRRRIAGSPRNEHASSACFSIPTAPGSPCRQADQPRQRRPKFSRQVTAKTKRTRTPLHPGAGTMAWRGKNNSDQAHGRSVPGGPEVTPPRLESGLWSTVNISSPQPHLPTNRYV